jgi:hypothetical protein
MARSRKNADELLLTALVCGGSVENAARAAGLSVRTVQRRLADPAFRQGLEKLRTEMVQRAVGMLTAAGFEAVKTLLGLLDAANAGSVRLGAARAILELGIKLREYAELAERISAVEAWKPNDHAAHQTLQSPSTPRALPHCADAEPS